MAATPRKLDFLYFDAGGGHRAAANALREVMGRKPGLFDIRLVNVQEQLDSIDVFRKATGVRLQDLYNLMLRKGWTLGSGAMIRGMHTVIRLFHRQARRVLAEHWKASSPDMVVGLIPNLNRAVGESLRRTLPGVPLVTILTDIADYPPNFWIERQEQHFICGSDKAVQQALSMGHTKDRVHQVSGMILNPRFYELEAMGSEQRAAARAKLGFDPKRPVGMVLFGGHGAAVMEEIAERLPDAQLLMICGHNERLAGRLRAMQHRAPMFVEGFTKDVPRYMQAVDYFIGKPGPGSISEAVFMKLPVIVERNAWTLPQERYNAEWIQERGVGIVVPNFRGIANAVDQLLDPKAYAKFRAATEQVENRAVFEIAAILEGMLFANDPPGATSLD